MVKGIEDIYFNTLKKVSCQFILARFSNRLAINLDTFYNL
jgi:hypothetical protein